MAPRGGPIGWPKDLAPPGSDEFAAKVTGWLLDRGPADLRASALRTWPIALAYYVGHVIEGELEATRRSYASARLDLGRYLEPAELTAVQAGLEAEGARLLQVQREVALVAQALRSAVPETI
jgi:hypothetical protein